MPYPRDNLYPDEDLYPGEDDDAGSHGFVDYYSRESSIVNDDDEALELIAHFLEAVDNA